MFRRTPHQIVKNFARDHNAGNVAPMVQVLADDVTYSDPLGTMLAGKEECSHYLYQYFKAELGNMAYIDEMSSFEDSILIKGRMVFGKQGYTALCLCRVQVVAGRLQSLEVSSRPMTEPEIGKLSDNARGS